MPPRPPSPRVEPWCSNACGDDAGPGPAAGRRLTYSVSLFPQPDLGHECHPALHLGSVEVGKFLHAEPSGLETDGAKLVLNLGLLDDVDDRLAKGGARLLRHARRPVDTEPS